MTQEIHPAAGKRRLRFFVLAVALLTAVCAIAFLSLDVIRKIDQQSTASTDNVQWTIAQVNVEYLQLLLSIKVAQDGQEAVGEVRRRFDVFYSRMTTMQRSPVFRVLREDPAFATSYAKVWIFLDSQVGLIDGSDEDLARGLGDLSAAVQALRPDASALGSNGIRVFAMRTDAAREGIARTLLQVSALTLSLLAGMGVLAATLARMNTAIKRQSRQYQEQGERVKAVFATSLDAVIVANSEGRILEFNKAAEVMFGYSADEVLGHPMGPLIVPPHLRAAHAKGLASFEFTPQHRVVGAGHIRLEAMRRGGEEFPIELAISVSRENETTIFISYLRDLSAQVAAEQELLRARDNALAGEKAKAELLAVMSHEMRTPLNGMLGTMELLKETRLTAKQKQYQRIMESSGRLLLHHVNDVLDIARVDSGKAVISKRPVDLAALIGDIVESQSPVAKAGVNDLRAFLPADGLTVIHCDPIRLRQVILNLVGNALKFTLNGEVRIEVERMDEAQQIELRVSDTGVGIAEADLDRIFEDFITLDASYSRSASGTGLGLGIVRRWVQAMGGKVGVESELGEGSLFWVRLPLDHPATRPEVEVPSEKVPFGAEIGSLPQLAVLVVEDNPINRIIVREMLELDGHTVVEANDGEEGIRLAAMRPWDVILMDVSMPQKDGVEATLAIRNSAGVSAQSPIVALTAHALPSETARFLAAGMQEVMTKPVSRAALRQVLLQVTKGDGIAAGAAPKAEGHSVLPYADKTVLAELRDTLGQVKLGVTVEAFLAEVDAEITSWRQIDLLGDRDAVMLASLQQAIHRVAGAAAMLGAAQLRAQLVEVETACKSANPHKVAKSLRLAMNLWPQTKSAMQSAMSQP
jgi:PAS domain S-box-containing protein